MNEINYKYAGIKQGQKTTGALKAKNESALREQLRAQGILLISVKILKDSTKDVIRPRNRFERICSYFMISQLEQEQAFLQLVILLKGDVAVVESFEKVAELSKGLLRSALMEVAITVKKGSTLSKALRIRLPKLGALYLGLIEIGEANGSLPQMFAYTVKLMQQKRKIRNDVVRAMTYPAIVILLGAGVGYYVSAISIPQIASVMGSETENLPMITQSLLATSDWIIEKGYWLVLTPIILTVTLILAHFVKSIAVVMDRIALWMPLIGKVIRFSENTLFNKTLALLLNSGISIVESLELICGTLTNSFYRGQVKMIRTQVLAGKMLSDSLGSSGLNRLCPLSQALIRVGENSGSMDEGLEYVGDYYEQALERRLELLGKLIEPTLIVVVGGMVAYVYVAFFMGMATINAASL